MIRNRSCRDARGRAGYAAMEFAPSYRRAAVKQRLLAAVGFLSAAAAWLLDFYCIAQAEHASIRFHRPGSLKRIPTWDKSRSGLYRVRKKIRSRRPSQSPTSNLNLVSPARGIK